MNFNASPQELISMVLQGQSLPEENPLLIYQAIKTCLEQIKKIKTEWSIINDPSAVAAGECEGIYIPKRKTIRFYTFIPQCRAKRPTR